LHSFALNWAVTTFNQMRLRNGMALYARAALQEKF
jgi:hypothetical protein